MVALAPNSCWAINRRDAETETEIYTSASYITVADDFSLLLLSVVLSRGIERSPREACAR
jgi:hypothetical protein